MLSIKQGISKCQLVSLEHDLVGDRTYYIPQSKRTLKPLANQSGYYR